MKDVFLTPKEIVRELDRYIVGQYQAKKAVAIAIRNRWRRLQTPPDIRKEITPNNIIMIGPTGVGKTEIARRLANLVNAPFIKVEASKFTEVGYVGRDVESMVRDLVNIAVNMVKAEMARKKEEEVKRRVEEKLVELLVPEGKPETKERFRKLLEIGKLEDRVVEITVEKVRRPFVEIIAPGMEDIDLGLQEMFSQMFPKQKHRKQVTVKEARQILLQEELSRVVDMDEVVEEAIYRVENTGIIFIDEIDKVAGRESGVGPDVSRTGVQRDLLPIVEGCTVVTKYGLVRTDHILFIAAGAFNIAKPSDLIPELQGRFPIRVELSPLGEDDFERILLEPENSLLKQYTALLATEGVELIFEKRAVRKIAHYAALVNDKTEDIGARRLHTVLSYLLEDILFEVPEPGAKVTVKVTSKMVREKLEPLAEDEDLTRYIL